MNPGNSSLALLEAAACRGLGSALAQCLARIGIRIQLIRIRITIDSDPNTIDSDPNTIDWDPNTIDSDPNY